MRLLIVEDDPDGREMLAELFRMHDWSVECASTTEAALRELRTGGFDVVISDEDLQGNSGSCMLRSAAEEGLLHHVGVLMYTAASEPERLDLPEGARVLTKPLGIAQLLDEAMAAAPEAVRDSAVPSSHERRRSPSAAHNVELVLYVTDSQSSRRTLENLQRVLQVTHPEAVKVVVRNLAPGAPADVAPPVSSSRAH
jgi:DNA-binding response OmpR family regulator